MADLRSEFPGMKGLSVRSIKYMRAFAEAYPDFIIMQQPVAQLNSRSKSAASLLHKSLGPITKLF